MNSLKGVYVLKEDDLSGFIAMIARGYAGQNC